MTWNCKGRSYTHCHSELREARLRQRFGEKRHFCLSVVTFFSHIDSAHLSVISSAVEKSPMREIPRLRLYTETRDDTLVKPICSQSPPPGTAGCDTNVAAFSSHIDSAHLSVISSFPWRDTPAIQGERPLCVFVASVAEESRGISLSTISGQAEQAGRTACS